MDRKKLSFLMLFALSLLSLPARNVEAQQASACKPDNAAWVGTFGFGVSCLDDSGWNNYVSGSSNKLQNDLIDDIAFCPDGSTWIANALGLFKVSATDAQAIDTDFTSIEAVACDSKNDVWVAHFQGVSHYVDGKWDTTDSSKLGTGDTVSDVKDVAVGPADKVYVVTASSVAVYDGSAWTVYEKGKGFDDTYFLEKIALDAKGNPYVAEDSGFLTFDGTSWKETKSENIVAVQTIAVDSKGVIWIGSFANGVSSYDGSKWTTYDRSSSKISSNDVHVVAVDGQDRVWAGTEYGLDVFDGKDFTVYRMDNSNVLDNEIHALAIAGKGPALPQAVTKKPGTLSGTLVNGKDPLAGAIVELCVEFVGGSFTGDTPCSDNPFTQQAKAGADGKFTFQSLPVGRYGLVVQTTDQKWHLITDQSGINSKVEVTEDRDTDIGTLDLGKTASS